MMQDSRILKKRNTHGTIVRSTWLLAGVCWFVPGILRAQFGPTAVETMLITEEMVQTGAAFVGTTVPVRTSIVGSQVEEKVIELRVEEGDPVRKGGVLACLTTTTLALELASAEALADLRKAELDELQNGTRPMLIEEAEASLAASDASRQYWLKQHARVNRLYEKKVSSQDELNDAARSFDEADQRWRAAHARLKLLREGPRREKIHQARAKLNSQGEEVRMLQEDITKHKIRSPFDGFVTRKHTEVGEWIGRGDPVVEIAELDPIEVEAAVSEDFVSGMSVGDVVRVEIPALASRLFTGKIAVIVPKADSQSRTFPVRVRFANLVQGNGLLIKAGMFAKVTFAVGELRPALLVPKDALVLGGRETAVYRVPAVTPGETSTREVERVPVILGVASGGRIEVTGNLAEGDEVVVLGNERLRPGQAVMVRND
jgi:HlyD family secretion protein